MTAAKIIEEIKSLPPREQAAVIRFAYRLDASRQLTGKELSALAKRMTQTTDPAESALVRNAIVQGFYGMTVCGEGDLVKTFLTPGQAALGHEVE